MDRPTAILKVDPDRPDPGLLEEAARVIRAGGLVAFATETVYGLGADATNPVAVARIFAAKGRPSRNPLIVHASDAEMARSCVAAWPDEAETLADRFWPGPLSLVLPRSDRVADLATANLPTVGVRVPVPAVARGLIARAGVPIAAPSANRSNALSPTLAEHVSRDLDGRVDLILDSGPTTIGLESTIFDVTSRPFRVLRPGPITAESLSAAIGGAEVVSAVEGTASDRPTSPGQLPVHYAPRTPAVWLEPEEVEAFEPPEMTAILRFDGQDFPERREYAFSLSLPDPEGAAALLYQRLHVLDGLGIDLIVIVAPPDRPEWRAVRDRLRRATARDRPSGA